MAHAAIAFAKAHFRRRMMACTTSIGPGATNLVTAAALAHVNRLPVLLLPGDIFVSRAPDPVLQQIEDFHDGGVSAQRLLQAGVALLRPHRASRAAPDRAAARDARADRPRALRPGHARAAAGRADDGVRLPRGVLRAAAGARSPRPRRIAEELADAVASRCAREAAADRRRRRRALQRGDRRAARFAEAHGVPVAETQAGKGALAVGPPAAASARSASPARPAANALARDADVGARRRHAAAGLHHRLALAVPAGEARRRSTSTASMRSSGAARRCVADARAALEALSDALAGWRRGRAWTRARDAARRRAGAHELSTSSTGASRDGALPYDGEVIGAVQRSAKDSPRARHRRLRRGHAARRAAQAVAHRRRPAATTSSTATRAWATRSPAASASRWRSPSARSS